MLTVEQASSGTLSRREKQDGAQHGCHERENQYRDWLNSSLAPFGSLSGSEAPPTPPTADAAGAPALESGKMASAADILAALNARARSGGETGPSILHPATEKRETAATATAPARPPSSSSLSSSPSPSPPRSPSPPPPESTSRGPAVQPPRPAAPRRAPVLPWMRVPAAPGGDVSAEALAALPEGVAPLLTRVTPPLPRRLARHLQATLPVAAGDATGRSTPRRLLPVQAAAWRALGGGRSAAAGAWGGAWWGAGAGGGGEGGGGAGGGRKRERDEPDGDLALCAPTGSGKTLAYSLPLVARVAWLAARSKDADDDDGSGDGSKYSGFASARARPLRGLVVAPTRDLARQARVHRGWRVVGGNHPKPLSTTRPPPPRRAGRPRRPRRPPPLPRRLPASSSPSPAPPASALP